MITKRSLTVFFGIIGCIIVILPIVAIAAEEAPFTVPNPAIKVPGLEFTQPIAGPCPTSAGGPSKNCIFIPWIGQYLSSVYTFAVFASTILAAIVLAFAGFVWLTAAGNSTRIEQAKDLMSGSLLGLLLMLGSYTILYVVNPDLVTFKSLALESLKRVPLDAYIAEMQAQGAVINANCTTPELAANAIKNGYADMFNRIAREYGLDPFFLAAVANRESSMGSNLGPSSAGAYGFMQIMPKTAAEIWDNNPNIQRPAECSWENDPRSGTYTQTCKQWMASHSNEVIRMGAAYFNQIKAQLAKCGQEANASLMAAGYNAGPYRRDICGGDLPTVPQTVNYVKKINEFMSFFCAASGGSMKS